MMKMNGRVMQRRLIQRMFLRTLAIALLMCSTGYGQSLGEIARENRDKQNADPAPTAKPKVITNKDLPKDPDANQSPSEARPATSGKEVSPFSGDRHLADQHPANQRPTQQRLAEQRLADQRLEQQRLAQQRAADQWKRQILAQKAKMAALQARVDQIHASIRLVNGSVQSDGPYNRYQAQQLQRVAQIQRQLNEQRWKLEQMQEAARHAGMRSAVYDP